MSLPYSDVVPAELGIVVFAIVGTWFVVQTRHHGVGFGPEPGPTIKAAVGPAHFSFTLWPGAWPRRRASGPRDVPPGWPVLNQQHTTVQYAVTDQLHVGGCHVREEWIAS